MDIKKDFEKALEENLDHLARSIVFNRHPTAIEFHKADFYSKTIREFYKALNYQIPEESPTDKEELVKIAKDIRKLNRQLNKPATKVKLQEL